MKQPLLAVLVLTLDDGTEIYRSPPVGRLQPGDSVKVEWSYPVEWSHPEADPGPPEQNESAELLVNAAPATLPITLRSGDSFTFTSTETYP